MAETILSFSEQFQPIPVRRDSSLRSRIAFAIRRFADLQPLLQWPLLQWPLLLLLLPLALLFLLFAHLTLALNLGSKDDPLGYSIVAQRRN